MLVMSYPLNTDKTLVQFFDDKTFKLEQEAVLEIETYNAVVSLDRRSQQDQHTNRCIDLGLVRGDFSNKLVKLNVVEDEFDSEEVLYSQDLVQGDNLHSCSIMNDDLIVAFHEDTARLYDVNLVCKQ